MLDRRAFIATGATALITTLAGCLGEDDATVDQTVVNEDVINFDAEAGDEMRVNAVLHRGVAGVVQVTHIDSGDRLIDEQFETELDVSVDAPESGAYRLFVHGDEVDVTVIVE